MSLIQLPGTSDVKNGVVSVGSSLLIPHEVLDLQKACKAQFIRKSPRRRWYVVKSDGEDSEQCILKSAFWSIYIFFHRGLDVFELLSDTFLSLLYALQLVFALKSDKVSLIKTWRHYTEILFLRLWESFFPQINVSLYVIQSCSSMIA